MNTSENPRTPNAPPRDVGGGLVGSSFHKPSVPQPKNMGDAAAHVTVGALTPIHMVKNWRSSTLQIFGTYAFVVIVLGMIITITAVFTGEGNSWAKSTQNWLWEAPGQGIRGIFSNAGKPATASTPTAQQQEKSAFNGQSVVPPAQ